MMTLLLFCFAFAMVGAMIFGGACVKLDKLEEKGSASNADQWKLKGKFLVLSLMIFVTAWAFSRYDKNLKRINAENQVTLNGYEADLQNAKLVLAFKVEDYDELIEGIYKEHRRQMASVELNAIWLRRRVNQLEEVPSYKVSEHLKSVPVPGSLDEFKRNEEIIKRLLLNTK